MDDELRMALSDIGSPEALAAAIVSRFGNIPIPVPLAQIAEAVGIVRIEQADTASFEGLLVTDAAKTQGTIAYNGRSRPERVRYTIAHELGHFLIPTHDHRAQCGKTDMITIQSGDARLSKEAEANRFAAALLMPKGRFMLEMRRLGSPEMEHIVALAAQFWVSKESAARRYIELAGDACAIVFSRDGKVRYWVRSEAMPAIAVKSGEGMPAGSIAAWAEPERGALTPWSEPSFDTWLFPDKRNRARTLYEQCLIQESGYRMILLTLEPEDEDADDDEEA